MSHVGALLYLMKKLGSLLLLSGCIAIAVSSCESRGNYKEKDFPTRVGSGIR